MYHPRLSAICLVLLLSACSKQGEGDRCLVSNGNGDCDSGLVCTDASKLADWDEPFASDRCCPEDGNSTNSRCKLRASSDGADGEDANPTETDGSGGTAGASQSDSTPTAGAGNGGESAANTGGTSTSSSAAAGATTKGGTTG